MSAGLTGDLAVMLPHCGVIVRLAVNRQGGYVCRGASGHSLLNMRPI
jgi:hypothetical protein